MSTYFSIPRVVRRLQDPTNDHDKIIFCGLLRQAMDSMMSTNSIPERCAWFNHLMECLDTKFGRKFIAANVKFSQVLWNKISEFEYVCGTDKTDKYNNLDWVLAGKVKTWVYMSTR